jgi:hypothetical protein
MRSKATAPNRRLIRPDPRRRSRDSSSARKRGLSEETKHTVEARAGFASVTDLASTLHWTSRRSIAQASLLHGHARKLVRARLSACSVSSCREILKNIVIRTPTHRRNVFREPLFLPTGSACVHVVHMRRSCSFIMRQKASSCSRALADRTAQSHSYKIRRARFVSDAESSWKHQMNLLGS